MNENGKENLEVSPNETKIFTLSESDFFDFESLSKKLDALIEENVKPE